MNAKYLCVGLLLTPPFAAQAIYTSGDVSMQVSVLDNTCSVDPILGNVVLGPVALRDIQNQGGTSNPVPFSVVLKGCGMYARSVNIYAQGTTLSGQSNVLALEGRGSSDTAEGVGVLLLDSARHVVSINQPGQPVTEPLVEGGDTAIDFSAQYVLTGATPRAGLANAGVMLTFTYQ